MEEDEFVEFQNKTIGSLSLKFSEKMENNNFVAKLIAAYIRNNIEGFHGKYLTDAQMKELNPLIRNAIYTALEDFGNRSRRAAVYARFYIPDYWEDCEFITDL